MSKEFLSALSHTITNNYKASLPRKLAAIDFIDGKVDIDLDLLERRVLISARLTYKSNHWLTDTKHRSELVDRINIIMDQHREMLAEAMYGEVRGKLRMAMFAVYDGDDKKAAEILNDALSATYPKTW